MIKNKKVQELPSARTLANLLIKEKVFGSWMLPEKDLKLMHSIFLPLALTTKEDLDKILKSFGGTEEIQVYGLKKDAMEIGINGYPIFSEIQFITNETVVRAYSLLKKMRKAIEEVEEEE